MKIITLEDGKWIQTSITNGSRTARVKSPADTPDIALAEAILREQLPDAAQLISIHIMMPSKTGVINCRIGLEHRQIKF